MDTQGRQTMDLLLDMEITERNAMQEWIEMRYPTATVESKEQALIKTVETCGTVKAVNAVLYMQKRNIRPSVAYLMRIDGATLESVAQSHEALADAEDERDYLIRQLSLKTGECEQLSELLSIYEESLEGKEKEMAVLQASRQEVMDKAAELTMENELLRRQVMDSNSDLRQLHKHQRVLEDEASRSLIQALTDYDKLVQRQHENRRETEERMANIRRGIDSKHLLAVERPDYWTDDEGPLVALDPNSREFATKRDFFLKSLGRLATVQKISRVQNKELWARYVIYKRKVALENKGNANEQELFHGSQVPDAVAREGLDERHAKNGNFGHGIYFGRCSQKSAAYGGNKTMFICLVALGNQLSYRQHEYQAVPKPIKSLPKPWHSIHTDDRGQMDELIVYRMEQSYPQYLIEFR